MQYHTHYYALKCKTLSAVNNLSLQLSEASNDDCSMAIESYWPVQDAQNFYLHEEQYHS